MLLLLPALLLHNLVVLAVARVSVTKAAYKYAQKSEQQITKRPDILHVVLLARCYHHHHCHVTTTAVEYFKPHHVRILEKNCLDSTFASLPVVVYTRTRRLGLIPRGKYEDTSALLSTFESFFTLFPF